MAESKLQCVEELEVNKGQLQFKKSYRNMMVEVVNGSNVLFRSKKIRYDI